MSFRRTASYTWRAFLTFLMIGIPGIVIQNVASWLVGSWVYDGGDGRPDASLMGWVSVARGISGLWVQFAVIFVIFKYAPSAILEVQESRARALVHESSELTPDLEQ